MAWWNVIEVTDANFEQEILNSEKLSVVDFWAPWCGPCKQFAPTFENLSLDYEGKVNFAKVNVDENQQYAAQFWVMSIPTVMIIKDWKVVDQIIWVQSIDTYKEKIDVNL